MLFNGEGPRCQELHLDLDGGDNGDSGAIEQAASVEAPSTDTPTEAPAEEYFHTITIPGDGGDDEVLNFKDPKELSDRYVQNRFRRSDYTKKTQELAEQRKAFQSQQEALLAKETSLTNLSNKYTEFDSMFKDIDAQQMQQIVQQIQGIKKSDLPPEFREMKDEIDSIKKEKAKAEKQRASEERKKQERQTFESRGRYLKTHYDDYEHESVMEAYDKLNSASPEEAHQAILEMLYFANKGRGLQARPENPQGPPRTKSAGRSLPPEKSMTLREAKQAAIESL